KRFERAALGVEAARIENGVVGAKKRAERRLQLLVHVLRATDEAYRCHTEAVPVETIPGGPNEAWVRRKSQIVVGAEVQHCAAVGELEFWRLRTADDALGLVETVGTDPLESLPYVRQVIVV